MFNKFRKLISCVLVVTTTMSSLIGPMAQTAHAATTPTCTNAYAANSGNNFDCGVRLVGGVPYSYPKLQWESLGTIQLGVKEGETISYSGVDANTTLGNRSAEMLGLDPKMVSAAATMYPSNVPFVVARYNPGATDLRIDIFRLEKAGTVATLMHSTFSPQHGDYWKAAGAYISPDVRRGGYQPGVNPFTTFQEGTDTDFHNISLVGSQVAIGHAMRLVQAPFAMLAVYDQRFTQEVKKSGGLLKKKTTTIIKGFTKPIWYLASPAGFVQRSSGMMAASYCATNPDTTSCPVYQTAMAGVVFEQFEGGTLDASEEQVYNWQKTKSGLGLLAVIAIVGLGAALFSFAMPALLNSTAALTGVTGVSGGVAAGGVFGTIATNVTGLIAGGFSSAWTAGLFEAAVFGAVSILGGADLNSVVTGTNFGLMAQVAKGGAKVDSGSMNEHQRGLTDAIQTKVTGAITTGGVAFKKTVYGNCDLGKTSAECGAAESQGALPRQDQYQEHNTVKFFRDNGGQLLRSDSPTYNK